MANTENAGKTNGSIYVKTLLHREQKEVHIHNIHINGYLLTGWRSCCCGGRRRVHSRGPFTSRAVSAGETAFTNSGSSAAAVTAARHGRIEIGRLGVKKGKVRWEGKAKLKDTIETKLNIEANHHRQTALPYYIHQPQFTTIKNHFLQHKNLSQYFLFFPTLKLSMFDKSYLQFFGKISSYRIFPELLINVNENLANVISFNFSGRSPPLISSIPVLIFMQFDQERTHVCLHFPQFIFCKIITLKTKVYLKKEHNHRKKTAQSSQHSMVSFEPLVRAHICNWTEAIRSK